MGLTLMFIEEHIPSLLKKLRNNTVWVPENRVRLGNAALEQLNIIGRSNESLLYYYQKTFTTVGRRALRERFITPISDISELKSRFIRIDYLRSKQDATIEKHLRSVYDLSRLHRKLHLLSINYSDIQHLLLTYTSIRELIGMFSNTPLDMAQQDITAQQHITAQQQVLTWFAQRQSSWSIERIKTADPTLLNRTHPWSRDVYPTLDAIEDLWHTLVKDIKLYVQPYSNTPISVALSEQTVFEFSITKKRFEKLPNSFKFHANSKTGGFLESKELLEFQRRGAAIQKQWLAEQEQQWVASLEEWSKSADQSICQMPISEYITKWIASVDVDYALARCAVEYDLITPTFVEGATSSVQIDQLRHPIIERIHTGSPYIRHDLSLGQEEAAAAAVANARNGLLVYGSNSSGKSSLMKALGIAVVCAQAGVPVAASSMTLSPYTGIFTRILGNDNLWAALSSFAVEMTEFRAILKYANEKSLVLGDELCSGTETRSATAIVSAGIQTMVKRGTQFLLATHLHEISELEEIRRLKGVKFAHLAMEYDAATKTIIYKRNLQEGSGSSLYGLEVCYGLDMDPEFLELARKCRSSSKPSRYNSAVLVRCCEVCKSERNLESHHIIHQADSKNGFVEPGAKVLRASNLTVLCEMCHKDHHAGRLTIHGWVDTSQGRTLQWSLYEAIATAPVPLGTAAEEQDQEDLQQRLKILLSRGKKEKEILLIIQNEFDPEFKLGTLRKWKSKLIKN